MKNLNAGLKKVEDFFIRVLDRKVEGAEMQKEGSRFSAYRDRGTQSVTEWFR